MSQEDTPSSSSSEPSFSEGDRPVMEIEVEQLEAARREPEVQKVIAEAVKQEERLEREGLIHP